MQRQFTFNAQEFGLVPPLVRQEPAPQRAFDKAFAVVRSQGALFWELRNGDQSCTIEDQGQDRPVDAHHILASAYGNSPRGFDASDMRCARTILGRLSTG